MNLVLDLIEFKLTLQRLDRCSLTDHPGVNEYPCATQYPTLTRDYYM